MCAHSVPPNADAHVTGVVLAYAADIFALSAALPLDVAVLQQTLDGYMMCAPCGAYRLVYDESIWPLEHIPYGSLAQIYVRRAAREDIRVFILDLVGKVVVYDKQTVAFQERTV